MLRKHKRLNLKTDFKWVAAGPPAGRAGKKLETKYLKLFIKTGDNQMPRIGVAVSAKSFNKATARNRARRLTSAAFETLYGRLPANINIVALPKTGVINVKSSEVSVDLETILKNKNLLIAEP